MPIGGEMVHGMLLARGKFGEAMVIFYLLAPVAG